MRRLSIKKMALPLLLLSALLLLAGCTTPAESGTSSSQNTAATTVVAAAPTPTATPETITMPEFNTEELAKYNGQNGNPAYVAVDGKVYDVSNVSVWKNGSHFGKFTAGQDLTEEIKSISPHGLSKLDSVPIVGLYVP